LPFSFMATRLSLLSAKKIAARSIKRREKRRARAVRSDSG